MFTDRLLPATGMDADALALGTALGFCHILFTRCER